LWPAKAKGVHQWAMAIDLDRRTAARRASSAAENNVPAGRDGVLRERGYWIRLDRYYAGEGDSWKSRISR
jgi:hypothetical protein